MGENKKKTGETNQDLSRWWMKEQVERVIDELPVIQDVPGWPGQHRVIGGWSETTVLTTAAAGWRMMAPE